MGHKDKSMMHKVYGNIAEPLKKDKKTMKEYFGEDFWAPYAEDEKSRP